MWAFYPIGTRLTFVPPSFPTLHDTSTSLRHQLHRKLGGMGGASEDLSSTSAGGTGIGHRGGGGGNKSSSRGGGCDGPGVPRRRRGLSWMAQTCSTAARSFDWSTLSWAGVAAAAAAAAATAAASGPRESAGARQPRARWRAPRHLHSRERTGPGGVPAGVRPPLQPPSLRQGSGGGGGDVDSGMGVIGNSSGHEILT
ncbi:unnamed protein product [Ectocarpus sp. 13 AM-2016]